MPDDDMITSTRALHADADHGVMPNADLSETSAPTNRRRSRQPQTAVDPMRYLDVVEVHPASGWVAILFAPPEAGNYRVRPLLFWVHVVDRTGQRKVDAVMEPDMTELGDSLTQIATERADFVCFARTTELRTHALELKHLASSVRQEYLGTLAEGPT